MEKHIIIIKKTINEYCEGTVIAVNEKFYLNGISQKSQLKIGNNVIFDKMLGKKINIHNKNLIIIKEKNISCILKN